MCAAISADGNVTQKEEEKKLNTELMYRDQRMWNMKYMIISVITGATGIETQGLKKNLTAIPGKHQYIYYEIIIIIIIIII